MLAVYSLKSQTETGTLQTLKAEISISGTGNPAQTINNIFNSIFLKVGSTTVVGNVGTVSGTAGGVQSAVVTFDNFSATLPADTFTDASIIADVNGNVVDAFESVIASTTLDLSTASNIKVVDGSFNTLASNGITLVSNQLQLTTTNVSLAGYPTITYGSLNKVNNNGAVTQQFTLSIPLSPSKNGIYISRDPYTAISTTTDPAGITIQAVDFSDSDTSGDTASNFYIAPGQAKTITVVYSASGNMTSAGSFQMIGLNYGTDASAMGQFLYSPTVTNMITATLFH